MTVKKDLGGGVVRYQGVLTFPDSRPILDVLRPVRIESWKDEGLFRRGRFSIAQKIKFVCGVRSRAFDYSRPAPGESRGASWGVSGIEVRVDKKMAAPRKTYRYMMEHAGDYLRNRFSKGHNETLSVLIDPTQKNFMDKILGAENRAAFNEFLSRTVRTGDIGAIIYGGYPRLKFLIEERGEDGKPRRTHDEAVEQFIRESEESQQSSTNAAQSNWQRTGKTKIFAMYKTSQIQYFRKVANAYNMMKRGEISREQFRKIAFIYTAQMAVAYTLMGELLSGILYGWDEDKGLVDELESLGLAIIAQAFDAWGVIGYLANQAISVVSGQKRQADLSLVGYSDVMQTINNANKIIKGKGGNAYFWVQTIAPLIEGTTGAPLGRYNRAARKTGLYDTIGI